MTYSITIHEQSQSTGTVSARHHRVDAATADEAAQEAQRRWAAASDTQGWRIIRVDYVEAV